MNFLYVKIIYSTVFVKYW